MPVLWWCVGVVLGVILAPWLSGGSVPALIVGATGSALAVLAGGATLREPGSFGRCALALSGLAVGLLVVSSVPEGPVFRGPVALRGVVVAASGSTADLNLDAWSRVGERSTSGSGRVRLRFREGTPPVGAVVVARGHAREVSASILPGAPDPVWSASRAGIRTLVQVDQVRAVGSRSRGRVPADPTGVLRAVAAGDRTAVDEGIWILLRRTGTAHLLAISGFHVGIVALVVGLLFRIGARCTALARPVGVPVGWSWVAGASAGFLYALAAGSPVSAQRAAWCLVGVALGRVAGRVTEPMSLLGCAAVAVLVLDPAAVGSAGMQLSFGAVVGILRVTPWLLRWVPPDLPWGVNRVVQGVSVTVAATVGTLPAAAWWFQEVAPLAPVANLVAMPVMAFVVVPCAALAVWGPVWAEGFATDLGLVALNALLALLEPLAIEPLHPAVGPVGAILLVAPLVWPGRPAWFLPWVVCALGLRQVPLVDRVTFLDVGQGDAALVELADGRRLLVDGGPPSERVLAWLRRRGIYALDRVVLTHGDADHIGGALPVLASLRVGSLWVGDTDGMDAPLALARERGIEVVHRPVPLTGDRNDRSLVLRAADTWFTGDIGLRAEAALAPSLEPAAVLKVPHHGSRSSSSPLLLAHTRPVVAVMGVGRRNLYGHPHPEVVHRYLAAGIALYRSDLHGTVEITVRPEVLEIRTFRAGRGWSRPRLLARSTGTEEEHRERHHRQTERDPLRIGQGLPEHALDEIASGLVPAEGLEHGAAAGIEHQVQQHHLTVELLPGVEQVHHQADEKEVGSLVQLGRM